MQARISAALDAPLDTEEQQLLRAHIATCPACAAFERALTSRTAGIAALPGVSGSARVREAVLAEAYRGPDARPRGWGGWAKQGLQLAGAAAVFALVAVVLMSVIGGGSGGDDDNGSGGRFGQSPGDVNGADASPTAATVPLTPAAAAIPCQPGQVVLETWTEQASMDEGQDTLLIWVQALKATGGAICEIDSDVTVSLHDSDGALLDIAGNELSARLSGLVPTNAPVLTFAWHNWCGTDESITLRVNGIDGTSEQAPIPVPSCNAPEVGSTLGLAAIAETEPPMPVDANGCVSSFAFDDLPSDPGTGNSTGVDDTVHVWISQGTGEQCHTGALTLTLRGANGEALEIDGNGMEIELVPEDGSEVAQFGIAWSNWCGEGTTDDITFELASNSGGAGGTLASLPACSDPGQPSQLTFIDDVPEEWRERLEEYGAAGEPAPLPECAVGDVDVAVQSDVVDGELHIYPTLSTNQVDCMTSGVVSAHVTDADGNLLDVDGNQATFELNSDMPLTTGSPWFIWRNWCGEAVDARITVTFNDATDTIAVDELPACQGDTQPSTLETVAERLSETDATTTETAVACEVVIEPGTGTEEATKSGAEPAVEAGVCPTEISD
jgi:hypothetical protein